MTTPRLPEEPDMPDRSAPRQMSESTRGEPRVFRIADLQFRANSPSSRSARAVTAETVGASRLLSGVFWSEPGSVGGWSFGDADPHVEGAPWVGVGEEVYLCLQGRVHVEWEGGDFEFGAGDIVFWPNDRWFRSRIVSDEPVQMFYCMAPPPTSMWGLGERVTKTGEAIIEP
jgi:Cupin domain